MAEPKPLFGISVLESLTMGMYVHKLDAVRELVQNACDSIKDARNGGLLTETAGHITVKLTQDQKTLTIRDDGTGISASDARRKLTNVGTSDKDPTTDMGFRGIGRLAGIAYCDRLTFLTSAKGEASVTEVALDAKGLREIMGSVDRKRDRAEDVLYACTDVKVRDGDIEDHFFEVRMERLTPEAASELLDFVSVHEYLARTAPVGFDTNFIFAPKIKAWLDEHHIPLFTVQVTLEEGNKSRHIYKPYKTTYKKLADKNRTDQERIEILDINFTVEPEAKPFSYWGWYSATDLRAQIGDENVAGLRLRLRNMSVGDNARLDELVPDPRYNRYFIGELHVLDAGCIPNARRDGIEDSPTWGKTKEKLKVFLEARKQEVRRASESRSNPVTKLLTNSAQWTEKAGKKAEEGFATKREREELAQEGERIKQQLEKLVTAKTKPEIVEEAQSALDELAKVQKAIGEAPHVVKKVTKGKLGRAEQNMLSVVLEILEDCLPKNHYEAAKKALLGRFGVVKDA